MVTTNFKFSYLPFEFTELEISLVDGELDEINFSGKALEDDCSLCDLGKTLKLALAIIPYIKRTLLSLKDKEIGNKMPNIFYDEFNLSLENSSFLFENDDNPFDGLDLQAESIVVSVEITLEELGSYSYHFDGEFYHSDSESGESSFVFELYDM